MQFVTMFQNPDDKFKHHEFRLEENSPDTVFEFRYGGSRYLDPYTGKVSVQSNKVTIDIEYIAGRFACEDEVRNWITSNECSSIYGWI